MKRITYLIFLLSIFIATKCYGLALPSIFQDERGKEELAATLTDLKALKDEKVYQHTFTRGFSFSGVGLHTGRIIHLKINPASPDTGIVFVREDLPNKPRIKAEIDSVGDTYKQTTLSVSPNEPNAPSILTAEHLLSALNILEVDNAVIEIDGPEVPIFDGSVFPFKVLSVDGAVTKQSVLSKSPFMPKRPILFARDERTKILYLPTDEPTLRISYLIDFSHEVIGQQFADACITPEVFWKELSGARTFVMADALKKLKAEGRYLGASDETIAIVNGKPKFTYFRFKDEAVKHKVDDLYGDLSLSNYNLKGHIIVLEGGHRDHVELVRMIESIAKNGHYGRINEWDFAKICEDLNSKPSIPQYFKDYMESCRQKFMADLDKDENRSRDISVKPTNQKSAIQTPDRAARLAELFKEEKFEGSVLDEAVSIISKALEEEHVSIPHDEKVKLTLVMRTLCLSPQNKSKDICEQLGIEKAMLVELYHIIRDVDTIHDIIAKKAKYPGLIYFTSNLLSNVGHLRDVLMGKPVYPLIVEWHPGERCNSNCVFCYSRGKNYKDRDKGREPVTLERIKELIHEFKANGVKEMWFSGGKEPFTNPITPKAIKEAVDTGLEVTVYSNGILWTDEARESVLGAKQVRISINAATPETYALVHGINGKSFERATSNLTALTKLKRERGAKVRIGTSFLIIPYSYNEIIKGAENAYNMGCDFFALRAEMIGTIRRFTEEEIQEILRQVEVIKKNKENGMYGNMQLDIRSLSYKDLSGEAHFLPDMKRAETCRVRAFKIGMNPYGIIYPCEYAEHPRNQNELLEIGNATKETFYDILVKSSQLKHDVSMCESCIQHEFAVNVVLEKLKDDMDYGIPLEDQPFASKPIGLSSSFDVEIANSLSREFVNTQVSEDRIYDIKYDTSRLPDSQVEVIKSYVRFLQSRSSSPANIRLKPFSGTQGSKESLIAVYCYGKDFRGEGHVDVSIQEGELKDYLLRMVGILNIALTSSNIPENLTREEAEHYMPLIDYVKSQYKAILGSELAIPNSFEEMLKTLRYIILDLPKSLRVNYKDVEEYNDSAKKALMAA